MYLNLGPDDLLFREEVTEFIADNLSPKLKRSFELSSSAVVDPEITIEFHQALAKRGWSVPNWPVEYGGTDWTPTQHYIFEMECGRAGIVPYNGAGTQFLGPVLIRFGNESQKRELLPRIRSGQDHWAQGFSEPGAGSDLSSLRTKARLKGDYYVVTGQKIWTTFAHKSNRIFMLVRTTDTERRQNGITFLIADLNLKGISIRPIVGNGGEHELNEVFFDDVHVPTSGLIGKQDGGWELAKYLLECERGGFFMAGRVRYQYNRLVRDAALRNWPDPSVTLAIAALGTDIDALEVLERSRLSDENDAVVSSTTASLLKLRWSETRQKICEIALETAGLDALIDVREPTQHASFDDTRAIVRRYLNARAFTIMGGTSQIQEGILAKSLLEN